MPNLGPDSLPAVLAACQAGAAEAAQALSRHLDIQAEVSVGAAITWDTNAPWAAGLAGPGLVVMLKVGGTGALAILPEASGLLPPWYAQPDATGESKLATLAQELGMLLLPEEHMPEGFQAARVHNTAQAAARAGVGPGAPVLPLSLKTAQAAAELLLVWPAATPQFAFSSGDAATEASQPISPAQEATADAGQAKSQPVSAAAARDAASPTPSSAGKLPALSPRGLPSYAQSLLRVKVPVVVTLARKKQPIGRILELGPGSIIQFDKLCDEMLDLSVAGQPIAEGEAVKIGEKFGLRLTSIVLPEERFLPLKAEEFR